MGEKIDLVEPSMLLKDPFLEMAGEFREAGEYYPHHEEAQQNFGLFIDGLFDKALGIGLPPGYVPGTTFWLVRDGVTLLGESRLRHWLTPALQVEGGHIGYAIRPSARRMGYGTQILALTLEKAVQQGLRKVLVTCDRDNIGSAKIIEKNGGSFFGHSISPRSGKQVSLYWIEL